MTASQPPIVIETERTRLRPHIAGDLEAMEAMWSHPEVIEFIMPAPLSRSEVWTRLLRYVGHWAVAPFGYWVIEDKRTGAFIGEVGFADWKREIEPSIEGIPEIGWVIVPDRQREGLARETVTAALAWADRSNIADEAVALINPIHRVSLDFAHSVGFGAAMRVPFRNADIMMLRRPLG